MPYFDTGRSAPVECDRLAAERVVASREALEEPRARAVRDSSPRPHSRPEKLGGYRLMPRHLEFWQASLIGSTTASAIVAPIAAGKSSARAVICAKGDLSMGREKKPRPSRRARSSVCSGGSRCSPCRSPCSSAR